MGVPYGYAKDSKAVYYENFVTFVSNDDGYFGWDAKHFYIQNKQVTEEEWNQKQH